MDVCCCCCWTSEVEQRKIERKPYHRKSFAQRLRLPPLLLRIYSTSPNGSVVFLSLAFLYPSRVWCLFSSTTCSRVLAAWKSPTFVSSKTALTPAPYPWTVFSWTLQPASPRTASMFSTWSWVGGWGGGANEKVEYMLFYGLLKQPIITCICGLQ